MKRSIGKALALYPTPLVVVGTMVGDKPNWVLVGHLGILGHDHVMVSLAAAHFTNGGIKQSGALSVNIVDEALLARADYVGTVSGANTDKSGVFAYHLEHGAPILDDAPVSMACAVDGVYETPGFESFVCTIAETFADERVLTAEGKLDYRALKPVLFEMPTYEYLRTGDVIAKCMTLGRRQA